MESKIDRSQEDLLCRLYKKADESRDHFVSGFSKLTQKWYELRHNKLGNIVHWKPVKNCNFDVNGKWCDEEPVSVSENHKVVWDWVSEWPCNRSLETWFGCNWLEE